MTAIELKSSIMSDLNAMSVELLEVVARYVRDLKTPAISPSQSSTAPRKIKLTDDINRLRGRFSIPANIDSKEIISDYLLEKHTAQ